MGTDFGLSKESLTESALFTSFVGTAGYLSPEMVARSGHGFPLDFYCLGCLLFCLLTGSLPHYEGDYKKMIERRVKGEPCAFPPWITPDAQDLIQRLLAPKPDNRLGARSGAIEVKDHPWVAAVDWTRVYRREPQACFPHFPPIRPSSDVATNFASEFTAQPAPQNLHELSSKEEAHPQVEGFSDDFSMGNSRDGVVRVRGIPEPPPPKLGTTSVEHSSATFQKQVNAANTALFPAP